MDIGTWVKAGAFVGIVSKVDEDGGVTVFNPGDRQMMRAQPSEVRALPTGTIEARVSLQVEVPHGLPTDSMKRWLAALIDPVLCSSAQATMQEHGLDDAPFRLDPEVEVREVDRG